MIPAAGEHGGIVRRPFLGGGRSYRVGDLLRPEEVAKWPRMNRQALGGDNGTVEWFNTPHAWDQAASEQAKPPASKRKK